LVFWPTFTLLGQIDTIRRSLFELGYDQPLTGNGPQGIYAYYYYNNPHFLGTNVTLRAAVAPVYLDGELGFKDPLSTHTDFGLGIYGGAYGDNFYEVRQGTYWKNESFDGYGVGTALGVYQLLNPGMKIPLHLVIRSGFRYTTYNRSDDTADDFVPPDDRITTFARAGLRFAGKEPVLNPELGLELSVWFERQWRSNHDPYGFAGDRALSGGTDLYWLYAGFNYSWTNIGHQVSFAFMAGGTTDADRFSAWRLGGVLPLISEFPLMLPGYYYQELTATRVLHFYGSYLIPLDPAHQFHFRLEAAGAFLDYLPGFEQLHHWQTGVGCGIAFTPRNRSCSIVARYGYGFNALRDGTEGAHSIGVLLQYDFERGLKARRQREGP
jgi:hypothetical protein